MESVKLESGVFNIKTLTYKQVKVWAKQAELEGSELELVTMCCDVKKEEIEEMPYYDVSALIANCLRVNQLGDYAKKN